MFENSGNPASNPQGSAQGCQDAVPRQVQCTIDQWFDISKLDGVKEFIIAPRNTGRMLFYDEYDRSEKDCMWEEY